MFRGKKLAPADNNKTTKTIEVKYFKVKHKVLKKSLNG
jgi:hypothetical protein